MTQKYKKEEKANKYIYRVPYQKNKTLLLLLLDITIQNWGFDSGARYSLVTANAKSASSNCLLFTIYACIFREDYGTLWPARNKIAPLPSTYDSVRFWLSSFEPHRSYEISRGTTQGPLNTLVGKFCKYRPLLGNGTSYYGPVLFINRKS